MTEPTTFKYSGDDISLWRPVRYPRASASPSLRSGQERSRFQGASLMNTAADRPALAEQSNAAVRTAKLLIDGKFVESTTQEWRDIVNPATQDLVGRVPFATKEEVDAAVASPV